MQKENDKKTNSSIISSSDLMLVKLHIQGLGISCFAEQTDTNHLEEKAFLSCDDM
jgi:hypothetical protein